MAPTDPITDFDLAAYVDGQLPPQRRVEVAAHLAKDPRTAAAVMADIAQRDALRLAFRGPDAHLSVDMVPLDMVDAADILSHKLSRRARGGRLRRIAAVFMVGALGWGLHGALGPLAISDSVASVPAPAFVGDAMRAHQTAVLRAGAHAAPDGTWRPEDIRAATAITLPRLPDDWRVHDLQIFPSTYGPSVEMTLDAAEFGTLSLFAVRPGDFAVTPVSAAPATAAETPAAYWQLGEVAYALVGGADGEALNQAARGLSESLF
ncbi:hypothetical protein L2U69_11350 [Zavarzinia compransoris]|uniref:anti-sigma factor family protein n=1 Tax=Zavarzinia marina TaxID=2911065 RepID=UPI001F265F68|nr:hypothetical protein [Zavarzinia marina]MCF4166242.1 hypothetical protein [Zavarzinia marina]